MLAPIKWINDYIDTKDIDIKELADKLNQSGSHVEAIELVDRGVTGVVVGEIKKIEKHPDADKLIITKIDVGGEEDLQIVTGADNVREGDYVPVAVVGSVLPGDFKIKKSKLRNVDSYGMLCSADELGIAENVIPKEQKDGIYILRKDYKLGTDIKEVLNLSGEVIEFEITPNRPDCLSILGMSREIGAVLRKNIKYPSLEVKGEEDNIEDYLKEVIVADDSLCNRYYAKVIKDIKIQPSPVWMQSRLMEAGIRPINNIVDITNYVMLELGQPMHAFDLDKLIGRKIVVKRANRGDTFKTLDDVKRKLDENIIMIDDANGHIGIAGIMGGGNTEIVSETKTIVLESANFNAKNIRLGSKKLGLRTEASSRLEKTQDTNLTEMACKRVCKLVEDLGAGVVVKGEHDVVINESEETIVKTSYEKINSLIGKEIGKDDIISILNSLELVSKDEDAFVETQVPTFRADVRIEEDIIEEIVRLYGLDNIEAKPLEGVLSRGRKSCKREREDTMKSLLFGMGFTELLTYSFISPKTYDRLRIPEESVLRNYIILENPLGEEYSVMRTTLMGNILNVLSSNIKHGVEKLHAYEIGNIFIPNELPVKQLPKEKRVLTIGMYGDSDFYVLKGIINELLSRLGIKEKEYILESNNETFHPGRTASLIVEEFLIGTVGEIHPEVLDNFDIKKKVYLIEMDVDALFMLSSMEKKYIDIPKYPSIARDIAMTLDKDIQVGEIEKIIWEQGKKLVEKVELFDIYEGKQVESDKKSVAYTIVYRSSEKTLTDEEIAPIHEKIVSKIENKLSASLRRQ